MDPKLMEPFIRGTVDTFQAMIGVKPEEKALETKSDTNGTYDVSVMMGMSGSAVGAVVVSFPDGVACEVVSRMLQDTLTQVDQDVADGVGEIVNIITGHAKRSLVKLGFTDINFSLPSVVVGKHRTVWHSRDVPCLMKRFFSTELGQFSLEVSIRNGTGAEQGDAS